MMPSLRPLFYFLWVAPHLLQIIILVLLARRALYRKFPVFAAYTVFAIFNFITVFTIGRYFPHAAYFQWYALLLGINMALRLGAICEIFSHVFADVSVLRKLQKPLFRWTTVAFLILAVSFAVYTHRSDADPTWFTVHVLERSANIVQCGLILALFLFSYYLNLSWSRPVFGIAFGVGVLCSVGLALAAVRSEVGYSAHFGLDLIDLAAYNCCVLIWLVYLLLPERCPTRIPDKLPESDLDVWNNELESLLTR